MNVGGTAQQKKTPLFSPRHSPIASSASPKQGRTTTTTTATTNATTSRSCCRGFNDCIVMGPSVSPHHPSTTKLEHQVAELEEEVQKQKELRAMYRMRMERTQDYLRYCLQIAQDNGFLDMIINNSSSNNKDNQQQDCLLSSSSIFHGTTNPPTPPPVQYHNDLSALVDQAKSSGWYVEPHEIELHEKIGQGSTADIYRGIWRGLDVAVKCIYTDFFHSNEKGVSFFAQEVETLSRQRHRFVLHLMGACLEPPENGWVVTEFLGMTLKEWFHGSGNRRKERIIPLPPFEERVGKALEIAQAMQYLHEQKPMVIHRDLKPSNIFLDDAMHVRVADFGHARFLSAGEKALTGETGTYVYMAPEVIRCEPYNEKCDVYSFAIILNELITGEYPYIETVYGPSRIALEVGEGKLRPALPEPDDQLEELIELIELSWDEDAAKRPSFATINFCLRSIQERLINAL